jgi:hypothetical protein
MKLLALRSYCQSAEDRGELTERQLNTWGRIQAFERDNNLRRKGDECAKEYVKTHGKPKSKKRAVIQ